jgi:CDP-archaeol synthase
VNGAFLEGVALVAPLLGGLVCHGVCIRSGLLKGLAHPIDGGTDFRGRRLLGDNKTFRGLLCVALGTAGTQLLIGWPLLARCQPGGIHRFASTAMLGAAIGSAAMVAELPNSFLKRQLAIAPGAQAAGALRVVFHVLDQVDVLVGAWLVLALVVPVTWERVLASAVFMYPAHQAITAVGYLLGMRATVR